MSTQSYQAQLRATSKIFKLHTDARAATLTAAGHRNGGVSGLNCPAVEDPQERDSVPFFDFLEQGRLI